jgi:hypothetical protein
MAEQRIVGRDGTVTILSDSYGESAFIGPPNPAENPSKWVATKLTDEESELLTGLNAEQRRVAEAYLGHPKGEIVHVAKFGVWPTSKRVTYKDDVEKWKERVAAAGLVLPKR